MGREVYLLQALWGPLWDTGRTPTAIDKICQGDGHTGIHQLAEGGGDVLDDAPGQMDHRCCQLEGVSLNHEGKR